MRAILAGFYLTAITGVVTAGPPEKWEAAANPWDRSLGSHRVVLKVGELPPQTKSVGARIEWRRPDREPEKKAVLVYDLQTGKQVPNVDVEKVTNESGTIIFEPVSGPGEYAVYFLPVKIDGGAFPVSRYLPPQKSADENWHHQHGTARGAAAEKVQAEVVRWESISVHDAWTEMEVIATEEETRQLAASARDGMKVMISSPEQALRMANRLPAALLDRKSLTAAGVDTQPGAAVVFQVSVWAVTQDLKNVTLAFPGEPQRSGELKEVAFHCLTTGGTDWNGRPLTRRIDIPMGHIQAFWCVGEIPRTVPPHPPLYDAKVIVRAEGVPPQEAGLVLKVNPPSAVPPDADPQSLSRLRWLNSTTAVDDEPVKGYEPLTVRGRTIRCLGRELELGEDGLPAQIRSYFNKAMTKVMETPTVEMLYTPISFAVYPAGDPVRLTGTGLTLTRESSGVVEWKSSLTGPGVIAALTGRMEFDGSVNYRVRLEAEKAPVTLQGVELYISRDYGSLDYMLGLNNEAGASRDGWFWNWDTANRNQDSIWLGAVNGGLRIQLKAEDYVRPGVNIHYKRRPLNNPASWNGGMKGSIAFLLGDNFTHLFCTSGPITLQRGKPLHFDFDLLITPFHTLQTKEQWSERYYHTGGVPQDYQKHLDGAKAAGANVVNIHQGNWLNPYINYPFLTWERLRDFSKAAHERGMRAKYYYTVRELSNWCPELIAFRSMEDEILMAGQGGGHPWGEEHLDGNYWQAWYEPGVQDVSFLTQPMSRFHNYYIEGLRWLCENAGCDGIYLDDIAYDRSIMLRARKVLDRHCPRGGLIDLHSWNEFHEGGAWAHCANIFMDSMPFVDRLWFGEGHHYTGPPPEHFLVEISGIPFGLMGEMLEGGGNPWFGLVHGMTSRLGWQGDPHAVWKLWDDFGVQDSEFIGWWAGDECPVRCADPMVKATVWKKNDATLVAVANFAKEAKQAMLTIDWNALGRDPAKAKLYFPAIASLRQKAALVDPRSGGFQPPTAGGQDVPATPLKPYSGAVFILDEKEHDIAAPPAPEALGAVILETDFTRGLDKSWKPVISPRAAGAGKLDAGYVLQMPANLYGFLERALPAEAGAVSARIWQEGNDQGQQWGPGLAVVWPSGKTLRSNVRHDGRLTVSENGSEDFPASITARAPVEFSIRWDKDTVKIIVAGPAMGDLPEELVSIPRDRFPGQPSLLRAGKMPNSAALQDFNEPGPAGFNRIEWIRIHGAR